MVLTLTGISKSFGQKHVLDGLDLRVDAGESVALLGTNGSGKTTMLRCVVGLARPDAGRVAICGYDAVTDGVTARRHLSYLPQKSAFPSTLTVRETLAAVARLRSVPAHAVGRELDLCGLGPLAERTVSQLSGGERQRLAIAVAFVPDVELYLFDEPTVSLDPIASRILIQRANRLKSDGRTLLFTTHVPSDVRRLATRILVLRDGRIDCDAAGDFELRRYERMLERDLWGDGHEAFVCGHRGDSDDERDWVHGAGARAAASAGRPR